MILGAPEGVGGTSSSSSSSIGIIGGLVASGDGPCAPANAPGRSEPPLLLPDAPGENRLSGPPPPPVPGRAKLPLPDAAVGDAAGGLAAPPVEGVGSGGVPWLNSAQRGHLRFVSARGGGKGGEGGGG